jgi:hypothetical protein
LPMPKPSAARSTTAWQMNADDSPTANLKMSKTRCLFSPRRAHSVRVTSTRSHPLKSCRLVLA